jgi:hypothetical protein
MWETYLVEKISRFISRAENDILRLLAVVVYAGEIHTHEVHTYETHPLP